MDLENLANFTLRNLTHINVLLGKNGCGKSFLLKRVEESVRNREDIGQVRYISPERGGLLNYEPGIDQNIGTNPNWLFDARKQNQTANFRQQSATLFRRLELIFLRKIEKEHLLDGYEPQSFDSIIDQLNTLLDRVKLKRHDQKGFEILDRENENPADPGEISSGEAELISLGIEFLAFAREVTPNRTNILLVDEPDVHLHPDLQDRLTTFIYNVFTDKPVTIIIATHSTALLAGLSEIDGTSVAFMRRGEMEIRFKPVTDVARAILPIFGAHPLSNVFNQVPILLLEGEDDERIWQQSIRSSEGKIAAHPCNVGGIDELAEYETEVSNLIQAVYDDAQGFSLRDRDLAPEYIDDVGPIIRMRLSCRAAENLMLTDDVLDLAGTNWPSLQSSLEKWIESNANHQYYAKVCAFVKEGFDRKGHDLKDIRIILLSLVSNKPWEVLVGQAIARLSTEGGGSDSGSLRDFLGQKVCQTLLKLG